MTRLVALVLLAGCGDEMVTDPDAAPLPQRPTCAPAPLPDDCPPDPVIDTAALVADTVDLARLARTSCVPYRTVEAASRDPRSLQPDDPDGWFANVDWGQYLRVEQHHGRSEHVMVDVDGPGALVHMWNADARDGTLRIYLDGADEPAIAADYRDLLTGEVPPFTAPFAGETSFGQNFDFPIPFRRHLKVTVEGPRAPNYYWQIVYRLYGPGADVRSYAPPGEDRLAGYRRILDGTAGFPSAAAEASSGPPARHARLSLAAEPGGSRIVELEIVPQRRDAETLRRTELILAFDGRETARLPLADFFGIAPGFHPHRTLPLRVTDDGRFVSRWVMPFACSADLAVDGPADSAATLRVRHEAAPFTAGSYHFHARHALHEAVPTRPFRDVTLVDLAGEGRHVGTALSVDSASEMWWGEGDEKIWVDDDAFPSWFGTGTEDYFRYAYSTRQPFDHAYGALRPWGDRYGQVSQARFHVLDDIPFSTGLRFDLELWHWDDGTTVDLGSVGYEYLRP